MASNQDQTDVLKSILDNGISQTKSSGGSILLFDSLKRGLVIATSAGSWEIVARFSNALLESGIWYGIKDMEEAVLFTDVEQHPLFERVSQHYSSRQCLSREAGSVEILLQPIRSGTEVLGLLNVFRERAPGLFVDADLELLTILAAQSGALIKSRQLFAELEDGSFDVLCSLASWVDNRSLYTQGHMKKVAELSEQLASAISLSEAEMKAIKQGAMVHDIGMIGVSDSILNKPGDLSPQEWDIVKFHPVIGEEIISPLGFMSEARYIVKHHHERLDSSGYPDALSGKQITSGLTVVSLCDAYDTMTSPRPWRPALSREDAVAKLREEKGAKFDPEITDTFISMMSERK
jgi:putative nucleotidyltransferase with HDIG domain